MENLLIIVVGYTFEGPNAEMHPFDWEGTEKEFISHSWNGISEKTIHFIQNGLEINSFADVDKNESEWEAKSYLENMSRYELYASWEEEI